MFIYQDQVESIEDKPIFFGTSLYFLTTKTKQVYISWDSEPQKARWWGVFDSIEEAKLASMNNQINHRNYKRVVNRSF